MKFFEHPDGSRTKYYERGDSVTLTRDHFIGTWCTDKAGTVGTVVRVDDWPSKTPSCVAFLDLHTTPGWGTIRVPQWDVEPTEQTFGVATRIESVA